MCQTCSTAAKQHVSVLLYWITAAVHGLCPNHAKAEDLVSQQLVGGDGWGGGEGGELEG